MQEDIFGGGIVSPPAKKRAGVRIQTTQTPLPVLYETIGAREDGAPVDLSTPPANPGESTQHKRAPHVRGSATSQAAAEAVTPKLKGKRLEMLRTICQRFPDGATDNVLIAWMVSERGWNHNTPRARRIELTRDGWLEEAGVEGKSTVWRPSKAALAWYEQEQARL